jgi:4-amino-4-deoxy-L-arabinose transferase-like glycosyltransferase
VPSSRPAEHRAAALVLLAGLLLLFPGLGNRDLWNPNEPVFAEGAREMLERREWLVPYVNGALYVDKPILYFWAILAGAAPAGQVTETSARLPSAVAGLLTAWVLYRFGRREIGARAGWLAALALLTMPIFIWESRYAQMDPMLALFMFLCLVCYHRAREAPARAAAWLAASGAWAGLAFLTKGPVGIVLPGGAALLDLAWGRELRFLRRPAWLAGAAAFLLVGAPWYIAVGAAGHTDWLREFFLRQNLTRFVEPFDHAQPWHYYGVRFVTDLFPWSMLLPVALLHRPRAGEPGERAFRLALLYAAVVLFFFSLSGAKRGVYILPLYPAYALIVGSCLDRALAAPEAAPLRRRLARVLAAVAAVLVISGAGVAIAASRRYPEFAAYGWGLGGLLAATGAGVLLAGGFGRRLRPAGIAALAGGLGTVYLAGALWVAPGIDPHKSAREFSARLLAHAGERAPIRSFRFWKWRSEYLFYTRRLMPIFDFPEQVEAYFQSPGPVFVLVEESDREELERSLRIPFYRLEADDVGDKRVTLLSNRPAAPNPAPGD